MRPYIPMILLLLFFGGLGLWNIFDKLNTGQVLISVDYLIPAILPLGLLYSGLIFALVKLADRYRKIGQPSSQHKKNDN
ncbi:hypothetical protein H1D31_15735 [Alishewanella sp. BS5-314]|uniref:hypothetical protein n=1 Tax=Alishewanella sp. BS5-314 TaxID=2755587 RepID=UPI0021BA898F|nr:hypothetical protein [Alishewanella sp. BS5-314]MCT8127461.1 hypothetical protein [Alishewanella sp. BS5-314]